MNIKTIALITATVLGGGSLLATNNTYADTSITIPFEDVSMCDAVVSSVGSGKIEENNCSNETNPNIVMTDSNIESITSLYLGDKNISKITGIEYFTSLTDLSLHDNQITDLTPLKDLTSLTYLDLEGNQITDLTPLKDLTNLTNLNLENNQITDLTPLSNLTSLTDLSLHDNQITDLTPLKDLKNSIRLDLRFNQITDLTPLKGLVDLKYLWLEGNPLNNIIPMLSLDKLVVSINAFPFSNNISSITTNNEKYDLPSLFLLLNNTLDIEGDVAPWITDTHNLVSYMKESGLFEFRCQNAELAEDGKSITIKDTSKAAIISIHIEHPSMGHLLMAQLTVTYEESPEPEPTPTPDDPTSPTNDPAVPDTGKNTKDSSTAALTATLCILSGIILTAVPMVRLYRKTREQ